MLAIRLSAQVSFEARVAGSHLHRGTAAACISMLTVVSISIISIAAAVRGGRAARRAAAGPRAVVDSAAGEKEEGREEG